MRARGIYLIGFSGTGKSTVAGLVGELLDWMVYDLDLLVAAQSGTSIADIFQREGEAAFRARETAALRMLPASGGFVAATGGGLPLLAENRQIMADTGWVVALEGRPETLHRRMVQQRAQADPAAVRPLLDTSLDQLRLLKERRQPVYALADWTVHTDRLSPTQVAAEIVRAAALLDATVGSEPPTGLPAH